MIVNVVPKCSLSRQVARSRGVTIRGAWTLFGEIVRIRTSNSHESAQVFRSLGCWGDVSRQSTSSSHLRLDDSNAEVIIAVRPGL